MSTQIYIAIWVLDIELVTGIKYHLNACYEKCNKSSHMLI